MPSWYTTVDAVMKMLGREGTVIRSKNELKKINSIADNKCRQIAMEHINQPLSHAGVGNKLRTYAKFKTSINMENYLRSNLSWTQKRTITKFRTSDHKLQIEIGRHCKPRILPEQRVCFHCKNKVEDEIHFINECPLYDTLRLKYNMVTSHLDDSTALQR